MIVAILALAWSTAFVAADVHVSQVIPFIGELQVCGVSVFANKSVIVTLQADRRVCNVVEFDSRLHVKSVKPLEWQQSDGPFAIRGNHLCSVSFRNGRIQVRSIGEAGLQPPVVDVPAFLAISELETGSPKQEVATSISACDIDSWMVLSDNGMLRLDLSDGVPSVVRFPKDRVYFSSSRGRYCLSVGSALGYRRRNMGIDVHGRLNCQVVHSRTSKIIGRFNVDCSDDFGMSISESGRISLHGDGKIRILDINGEEQFEYRSPDSLSLARCEWLSEDILILETREADSANILYSIAVSDGAVHQLHKGEISHLSCDGVSGVAAFACDDGLYLVRFATGPPDDG